MEAFIQTIKDTIGDPLANHEFYLLTLIAAILLFILLKGRRVSFVLPLTLFGIAILNPFFKWLWEDWLHLDYYWRVQWIVPLIPFCAALPAVIVEKTKHENLKGLIAILCCVFFLLAGSFLYKQPGMITYFYFPAPNLEKVHANTEEVAKYLLGLEESPRIVVESGMCIDIREYSAKIQTLYGRNVISKFMDTPDQASRNAYRELEKSEDGDMAVVAAIMRGQSYPYLVIKNNVPGRRQKLEQNGLKIIHSVQWWDIYSWDPEKETIQLPVVMPETIQKRAAGRTISITENEDSKTIYAYDQDGNIVLEFRTETGWTGIADSNGYAGFEKEYDRQGHLLMESTLGVDGNLVANAAGYAEVRREYLEGNKVQEAYYGVDGQPVNRTGLGYARSVFDYNSENRVIREQYFDQDNHPVFSSSGFASVSREYSGRKIIRESYFDTVEQPICIPSGYASVQRRYDKNGYLTDESFFDTEGNLTNCVNGYAKEERINDEKGQITVQRFFDSENQPVVTYTGYAEVRRMFDDAGDMIREDYFGADGQPIFQAAGYTAIEQEYDGEGNLIRRRYLDLDGKLITRTDGYAEVIWHPADEDQPAEVSFMNANMEDYPADHLNLVKDVQTGPDGWSQWMIPKHNTVNDCFNIGYVNLGEKQEGDLYTCQIEVEFKNVTVDSDLAFRFWAQGAQDNRWFTGNVWNSTLISFSSPPEDGVYTFTSTQAVSGEMVNVSTFNVGFRCDNWSSGMFRVRCIKIEKGDIATDWSPGI